MAWGLSFDVYPYNELLSGCLDGEVAALQQRKAEYDEARRQPDGSDTCGSCSDTDSGSEAELCVLGLFKLVLCIG